MAKGGDLQGLPPPALGSSGNCGPWPRDTGSFLLSCSQCSLWEGKVDNLVPRGALGLTPGWETQPLFCYL